MRKFATYTEYSRDLRSRRTKQGLCWKCGGKLSSDNIAMGKMSCDVCREKSHENYLNRKSIKKNTEYNLHKKKPKYTIDELAIIARERGISYGLLVAEMESR